MTSIPDYKFDYAWYPVDKWQGDIYYCIDRIYEHCVLNNVKDILEIGSGGNGVSTWTFLKVLEKTGGHLTSVDLQDCSQIYPSPNKTFIRGDSRTVEVSGMFDCILLDSSHEEEQTRDELIKYVPKLRKGGLFLVHDTNQPSVSVPLNMYVYDKKNLGHLFTVVHGTRGGTSKIKMEFFKKL